MILKFFKKENYDRIQAALQSIEVNEFEYVKMKRQPERNRRSVNGSRKTIRNR